MKYKQLIFLFVSCAIGFVLVLELLFHFMPIPTNITETRLQQIEALHHHNFDQIYFGSSVTLELMGENPYKYNHLLNLTTAAGTTLAGQYLLAEKVLKKTKTETLIFSFVPIMLSYDVISQENKQVSRFFNQPFNHKAFLSEIRKYKKDYFVKDEYFMSRQMYIDKFLPYILKNFMQSFKKQQSIDIDEILNREIDNNVSLQCHGYTPFQKISDFSLKLQHMTMAESNTYFLHKIQQLNHQVKITLVLEPVPETEYIAFIQSDAYKALQKLLKTLDHITFIDTNKYITFKDCFFKDYLHLKSEKRYLYEYLIFSKIIHRKKF